MGNTLITEPVIAMRLEVMLGVPCRVRLDEPDPDELDADGQPFPPGWMELVVFATDQSIHRSACTMTQLFLTDLTLTMNAFAERFLEAMVAILRYALWPEAAEQQWAAEQQAAMGC